MQEEIFFHHWTRWIWQNPSQTHENLSSNFWHAANAPVSFQDAAYAKIPPSLCDRNALNDLLYSNLPHSLTQKDSQLQGTEQSHCHQRKMQIITQQTMQK